MIIVEFESKNFLSNKKAIIQHSLSKIIMGKKPYMLDVSQEIIS